MVIGMQAGAGAAGQNDALALFCKIRRLDFEARDYRVSRKRPTRVRIPGLDVRQSGYRLTVRPQRCLAT